MATLVALQHVDNLRALSIHKKSIPLGKFCERRSGFGLIIGWLCDINYWGSGRMIIGLPCDNVYGGSGLIVGCHREIGYYVP